jgi:fucose 4-O-acetylase-like acetyltransferase
MWTKKTEQELIKAKREGRFSLTFPLLTFFIIIVLYVYTDITGQAGRGQLQKRSLSWTEIYNDLPRIVSTAFWFAIIVFAVQILFVKSGIVRETPNSKLCLTCGKVLPPSLTKCECGGELDLLENYKWEERQSET